jgi:hypothetical protein
MHDGFTLLIPAAGETEHKIGPPGNCAPRRAIRRCSDSFRLDGIVVH